MTTSPALPRRASVLVADDAPLIRERLAGLISRAAPLDVLESADVADTVRLARERKPALIVLDLFLRDGTGLDVLRALRGPGAPRIIVLTAWADEAIRRQCLEAGAELFFEKGAQFDAALAALEAVAAEVAGEAPRAVPSAPPQPLAAGPAAGLTVLVAEDHDFQRRALARLLKSMGAARVLEAADGAQALELLRRDPAAVHVIVSDLEMPEMDGMALVRHLAETGAGAALILVSAQDPAVLGSVHTMCQAYGIQPAGTLEKPATPARLAELLARMGRPRAARPGGGAPAPRFAVPDILAAMRRGELEPFFQAKADLATRRIVGAEALARWRHPQHGVVPPAAFIAPLEEAGEIDELTFLMIERSARACRAWRERGLELDVSVNLSLASLSDHGLAARIAGIVERAGLEPRRMTLEVTETSAMTNAAAALENLARLRLRGFGLSIDDFGTGFSSMQQLGRIAFTELKIDRGFVAALEEKREARAIAESSIDIARRLGLVSVAEGVETAAQWQALEAMGCGLAQGYAIARPLPEAEFVARAAEPAL